MTQKSALIKVISILMIIFSAIALFSVIGSIAAINAMGGMELLAFAGIDPGMYMFAIVISVIACVFELVAGILGLASKSKSLLEKIGIVLIIIQLVSLIFTFVTGTFAWTSLISFILPILYYLGAKQCIQ